MNITITISDAQHAHGTALFGDGLADLCSRLIANEAPGWAAKVAEQDAARKLALVEAFEAAADDATKAEIVAAIEGGQ